ncbi:hypothetical protein OIU78_023197 [Salix suchowensis]|nr:hypothetical protein OIU78_023197 [Salix suchowensis]
MLHTRTLKSREKGRKDHRDGREEGDREVYGKGRFQLVNSDGKRKRIYADQYGDQGTTNNRKVRKLPNLYLGKGKVKFQMIPLKGKVELLILFAQFGFPNKLKAATSETKRSYRKVEDTTVQVSSGKWNTKVNEVGTFDGDRNSLLKKQTKSKFESGKRSAKTKEEYKLESGRNALLKKQNKSNYDSSKHLDHSQSKSAKVSPSVSNKKSVQRQKSLADSETMDDQPHKRKRIRLDPYDTSNKRLDDGIISDESTKERKKELEKDAGMSMNNFLGRRRLIELKRAGYNTDLSAPLDNIPFSTSSERERIEENIFRNKLTFFAAAKVSSSFPPPGLPEIAFAGRSNVGKSSLLNSLTRQWGVARTSDKPGLTQTINFFELGNICLVDLPGYGFAYAKEEVKDSWEELVKEYVSMRVNLKKSVPSY